MGFVKVGTVDEVPQGASKLFEIEDKQVSVFNVGGTLYAVDDACPHRGASLGDGEHDGFEVQRPRHAARFDVRSGDVLAPLAQESVTTFSVRVQGNDIELDV
ncbi:MAG: Rieske 2Fe-2S domain-containing protein [SAR202 cluster bacterium]|jgi:3-phenylpropionate/trans-cinnamate dioxygenase ferredoxin subunit|nr:Rieske 2Fe-2S domain-containing protein [SAR202 cluster bacterium]MDP6302299.1 Rieske 2Fe-2S domain-containing protein [SAR202 cluster bacterium]MDP7103972.1 Rieske 2Fe-2S domain-containing protein [SAR202 cluster bacterium]MDP7225107.1 Rieske 2Fe-2S domain-containing protein [SAR202 cluster bacterium]MDP7413718.1 Rieske 2Fe-2S domain-containing protein [SAR202 cluster bacterium]|tara:strand:- start:138 stop:443 length:306 start_codon:yes stop_codon:yes gene_type:complete